MIEHNNRDIAKKHAEFITGQELRLYIANKVSKYIRTNPTVFDGAIGSGQLEQYIRPKHLIGVEIQEAACKTFEQNDKLFPSREIYNESFFNFDKEVEADCVVMNPPFSLKFKELSEGEKENIQKEFPWKKSGVIDDIFILKSLNYTNGYAFHICFPGITYRKSEQKMRELIGDRLIELNYIQNAFDDTPIPVVLLVIAKEKTTDEVYKEIFDCKTKKFLHIEKVKGKEDKWSIPSVPQEQEVIDIDAVNADLDRIILNKLKNHLELNLGIIRTFNVDMDYLGFIDKVQAICDEYRLAYQFNVNTFSKY